MISAPRTVPASRTVPAPRLTPRKSNKPRAIPAPKVDHAPKPIISEFHSQIQAQHHEIEALNYTLRNKDLQIYFMQCEKNETELQQMHLNWVKKYFPLSTIWSHFSISYDDVIRLYGEPLLTEPSPAAPADDNCPDDVYLHGGDLSEHLLGENVVSSLIAKGHRQI